MVSNGMSSLREPEAKALGQSATYAVFIYHGHKVCNRPYRNKIQYSFVIAGKRGCLAVHVSTESENSRVELTGDAAYRMER